MVGVQDYFFQIVFVIVEGGFGFVMVFVDFFGQFFGVLDWVYVVFVVVLVGFQYQGIVDFGGFMFDGVYVIVQYFGCGDDWDVCFDGYVLGVGFVVKCVYCVGGGVDEGDFGSYVGIDEIGVF